LCFVKAKGFDAKRRGFDQGAGSFVARGFVSRQSLAEAKVVANSGPGDDKNSTNAALN
jgi:hypothetical protein